jgi:hypothetical protein
VLLNMLSWLIDPSRCSTAVEKVTPMSLALPLLGALVSSVKAVKVAAARGRIRRGSRAEVAYLLFQLSIQTSDIFSLLNAVEQQMLILESAGLLGGHHQVQQQSWKGQAGEQCGHAVPKQEQQLSKLQLLLWTGLLVFECALSLVGTFAFAPAMLSFRCLVDERVGLGVAGGIAPPFKGQLLELLQGRRAMMGRVRGSGKGASSGGTEEAGATPAAIAPEAIPGPLVLQVYMCLQAFVKTAGYAPLMKAYRTVIMETGEPAFPPAPLFIPQHEAIWQRVLLDAEEGSGKPRRIYLVSIAAVGSLFRALQSAQKLVDAPGSLQQLLSALPCSAIPQQNRHRVAKVGSLMSLSDSTFCSKIKNYLSASAASFCCSNPSCMNLSGPSELKLVWGGAAGRGGGYCCGCKRVCYCSKACQRVCWGEHREVCSMYQQE